ncbi:protein C19orf12 homolog [Mercenaria mercenaria]|uniref:protein C19orf12 homolog n=1 Tax=Mercenaria mercenaria TaxID=6596 RepID=UPI00234EA401|nr:protein C19orf12 homolog [Mercenaria mercenaria]XP_053406227.1 protein C19orf12 homolog [Mercenaria mercenaria]XP_053406228.1 protein C19orf12 homolog [Mercenaria mercenaria]
MASNLAGMAFIPYYKHLMEILETNEELKKTSKGIFKQMAWAAGGTCAGGIVAGPPGALVGGFVGSVIGYCKSDEYSSMIKVIKNLSDSDKQRLVEKVQELVGSSSLEALTAFIGSKVQRELLLNCIRSVLQNKGGG